MRDHTELEPVQLSAVGGTRIAWKERINAVISDIAPANRALPTIGIRGGACLPVPLLARSVQCLEAIFEQIYPHAFDVVMRVVDPVHRFHVEIEQLLIAPADFLP